MNAYIVSWNCSSGLGSGTGSMVFESRDNAITVFKALKREASVQEVKLIHGGTELRVWRKDWI